MPCIDFGYDNEAARTAAALEKKALKDKQDKLDKLTRLLCEATKILSESIDTNPSVLHGSKLLKTRGSAELQDWHKEHVKADAVRKLAATNRLTAVAAELGYNISDANELAKLLK